MVLDLAGRSLVAGAGATQVAGPCYANVHMVALCWVRLPLSFLDFAVDMYMGMQYHIPPSPTSLQFPLPRPSGMRGVAMSDIIRPKVPRGAVPDCFVSIVF